MGKSGHPAWSGAKSIEGSNPFTLTTTWQCSLVGQKRLSHTEKIVGSNPTIATVKQHKTKVLGLAGLALVVSDSIRFTTRIFCPVSVTDLHGCLRNSKRMGSTPSLGTTGKKL